MLSIGLPALCFLWSPLVQAAAMLHAVAVQSSCDYTCRLEGTSLHPEADSCTRWRECACSRQETKQKGGHVLSCLLLISCKDK